MNKIHIGYPKTATTYLQKNIFPQLQNHDFIGHKEYHNLGLMDIIYKPKRSIDFDKYQDYFKNKITFISFEELTGPLFHGSFMIDEMPSRLENILGKNTKILITIRKQDDLLKSTYVQYLHQGGTSSLESFLCSPKYGVNRIDLKSFDFLKTYKNYTEVFGEDHVTVIPYETLKKDSLQFINELELFFGNETFENKNNIIEYRSLSGFQLTFLRFLNRFLESPLSDKYIIPSRFINQDKLRRKLQRSNSLRFGSYFSEKDYILLRKTFFNYSKSNRILDEKLNLNLKEHGYY